MKICSILRPLLWLVVSLFSFAFSFPAAGQVPVVPVLSIVADPPRTSEPLPTALIAPGRFFVSRTGSTDAALTVHLQYSGTAGAEDYEKLPTEISIPAGTNRTQILVLARADDLVEGTEEVIAKLVPASGDNPAFRVDPEHASAAVQILDEDKPSSASLKITQPENGAVLPPGQPVKIEATAIDPAGYIPRVEFYDVSVRIGVSEIVFVQAPPPGTPIQHSIIWTNPLPGEHLLSALAKDSAGRAVVSDPVRVFVSSEPIATVVRIAAIDPEATELPPIVDAIDPARFEISREGSTERALTVFFSVHGSATEGGDYREIPHSVTIPEGQTSATVEIAPIGDLATVVEPMETVALRLEPSPLASPLPSYSIDPLKSEAAAVIYEQRPPASGAVDIALPSNGEKFESGASISILAAAYHPTINLRRIEFFADGLKIGVSEVPGDAQPGGLFFHHFTWKDAPAGPHVLTAAVTLENGTSITSRKVNIVVGGEALPVVSIRYLPDLTLRPVPNADYAAGVLEIRRTGPTAAPLAVYFNVGGSATPGLDYRKIDPNFATIPAGEASVIVSIEAIDDQLVEGNETVELTLIPHPLARPSPYTVDPEHRSAAIIIVDNDQAGGQARIEITSPRTGDISEAGVDIPIKAVAVDPNGYIPRVEFHANDRLIGVSQIEFFRAPDPGTPIIHTIIWTNPPPGDFTLTATAIDAAGNRVVSNPVKITVRPGTGSDQVVVNVTTVDASASEASANGEPDPAVFLIQRVSGKRDVDVAVYYKLSGTAQNGTDYSELSGVVKLPAGVDKAEVVIKPIPDKALEPEETVILTLQPSVCIQIVPPPPECYRVGEPGEARAVIHDTTSPGNLPPRVGIGRPKDGTVFSIGQAIEVRAEAADPDGTIQELNLFADDKLIGSAKLGQLTVVWSNAPAGPHTLHARAIDNAGATGESVPVRILVREGDGSSFVRRELPAGYVPTVQFTVGVTAEPVAGTRAWAVEDQPPKGWKVSEISNDGAYDPTTGKVKFGPYTDDHSRILTYNLTPPDGTSGRFEFGGTSSANGASFPIGGDRLIEQANRNHPADSNRDLRITVDETTAYAAAWKGGELWPQGPNPIPITYVTRAAMLWRQGEAYQYDPASSAPFCWLPIAVATEGAARSGALAAVPVSTAVRFVTPSDAGGAALKVTVAVSPKAGVRAYAVEEKIPEGWTVANVDEGVFDARSRTIRWGVYLDDSARSLTYSLAAVANGTSIAALRGTASFDGAAVPVSGSDKLITSDGAGLLRLPAVEHAPDGSVRLQLAGAPGQLCVLEVSADLNTWTEVRELFLPEGQLSLDEDAADKQKYYRLRVR